VKSAGHALRWLVAVPTLLGNLGFGLLALLWVCCGSDPVQNLRNPLCSGSFAGAALGLAALPPVEARLGAAGRWLVGPFVIVFGVFVTTGTTVVEAVESVGAWYIGMLAVTGACAALAIVRLVAPRR